MYLDGYTLNAFNVPRASFWKSFGQPSANEMTDHQLEGKFQIIVTDCQRFCPPNVSYFQIFEDEIVFEEAELCRLDKKHSWFQALGEVACATKTL